MSDVRPVALVTGGNRGLGLETCRQLARRGYSVVLAARDEARGRAAAQALRDEGHDVVSALFDLARHEQAAALASFVRERFGRLDVLVNNAAVLLDGEGDTSVLRADPAIARRTFEINVLGPMALTQALIPLLAEGDGGRVVNVSSGMGQLSEMGGAWPAYRMSKTALNALTRIFAAELKGTGVTVNSVCPGWVRTDMGGPSATRSVEEGVASIVWLATHPPGGPDGAFYRDQELLPW